VLIYFSLMRRGFHLSHLLAVHQMQRSTALINPHLTTNRTSKCICLCWHL